MRKRNPFIVAALAASLLVAACGDDENESGDTTATTAATETTAGSETTAATETTASGDTTTTVYAPPERGDADLVIWADDTRTPVLQPIADAFGEAQGIKVSVLEVPNDKIKENLIKAGPVGQGPDIVVGAHDWLGELVANGAVSPLELPDTSAYAEVAIQGFTFDGAVYGLPYAIENIALIRNTELVPDAPATFEELEQIALQLVAEGKADVPLAIQEGPADVYHNYPLYTMTGASVFAQNADGTYDPNQLGLDSPEALQSAQNFADWSASGLISKDVDYGVMIDSFGTGRAPFAITGPWAISQGDTGFAAMGVPYAVGPIPPLTADGPLPRVFVGVQGFMLSAYSENADLAKTFILEYLGTPELQVELFEAGGRTPAMLTAYEQVSTDPDLQGFFTAAEAGQPMPNIVAMGKVWDLWKDAYSLVFAGNDPASAFQDAAQSIRDAIAAG